MTVHAQLMTDLSEIISTVSSVSKVTYGPHTPLASEDTFTSVTLVPGADTWEPKRLKPGADGYDNSFFVRVIINENCDNEPLKWCDTRDTIIRAVLQDSQLWTTATDRDIVSVVYDDMNTYPKLTMELLFEFRLRETCE